MNIAIVCYPTFGGSGVLATELGKALADKGHYVHFITYQQPVRLSHFHTNIFYHEVRVPTYPLFDYPPYETALSSTMVGNKMYVMSFVSKRFSQFCCQYTATAKGWVTNNRNIHTL